MSPPPPPRAVVILERSLVSPPPGSVPTTSLPLTFFDLLWHLCCPMQRLFFYPFPHSSLHFSQTLLPSLKHSLSLALHSFFPFAGNLICPPAPAKPHILFAAGDAVPFAVAEAAEGFDFDDLAADQPRDVLRLHPYVAELPPARAEGGARVVPLMAVQVTVFPGAGFALGVTFCHVAADGRSFHHFMKSWASLCKNKGDPAAVERSSPFYGRDSMKLLDELDVDLLKDFWAWASNWEKKDLGPTENGLAGKVRATFLMGQAQIQRLKQWVRDHQPDEDESNSVVHMSTFVVTCALVWVCLIKSEESEFECSSFGDKDEPYFFVFSADCRGRLDFSIPTTYFGNCLTFSMVSLNKSELVGVNGIVKAVKAIGTKVRELECGALEGAENWMKDWKEILDKYRFVTVAGSPKLGIYETDFGWGRPKKADLVHTDVSGAISLCDHREDKHGIEVNLALPEAQMDRFSVLFLEESLKLMA